MTPALREVRLGERPTVLAVLPHYGAPAETVLAVHSLIATGYPKLQLLVVDNSSNLAAHWFPEGVELLQPGENIGYCAAINRGIDRAAERGDDMLLMINNDTQCDPGSIERLAEAMVADPTVAGVGPLLTTEGGGTIWSAGSYLKFGPNEVRQHGLGRPVSEAPPFPAEVDFVPGALALYWTEDLVAVGGVEEDYFMYLEDADLGCRLRKRGRRMLYLPWVRVHHGGSLSSGGGVSPLRKFLNGVNTPRFLRRHGTPRLWLSFVLFDVLGLVPSVLRHLGNRRRLRAQVAKGYGIARGFFGYRASPKDVERYVDATEVGEAVGE